MNQDIINGTVNWIEEFIIKLNICPFASVPYYGNKVDLHVLDVKKDENFLSHFLEYLIQFIDEKNETSNAFLILPHYKNFELYLNLYYKCEELLKMSGSDALVQLASFHPDYMYENTEEGDPSNYRNRSPYAMIHLLRTEEVEAAIRFFGDTNKISEVNIQKLSNMQRDELDSLNLRFKSD